VEVGVAVNEIQHPGGNDSQNFLPYKSRWVKEPLSDVGQDEVNGLWVTQLNHTTSKVKEVSVRA
jgi:hypothetical protein